MAATPACKRGKSDSTKTGEVLAQVGSEAITTGEFKARMNEQSPFIQARYTTLEKKKEFLDNLIRMDVLAQEARRRGLEKDPEVQSALSKIMIQKLLRQQYEESSKSISDSDLKAYYQDHQSEFVRPERVRASHIFIAAPKNSPKRAQAQAEAAKLVADLKGKEAGPNKTAFAQAAQAKSNDPATQSSGGDLGFRTKDELAQLWGAELAGAAEQMKVVGEISGPVATDKGFHLVKLTGRQPGLDQPFETVKPRIEARLSAERRSKSVDTFIAQLKEKANVKVDEEALKRVEVKPADASASAHPGGMMPVAPRPPGH